MNNKLLILLSFIILSINYGQTYNILGLFTTTTQSHLFTHMAVIKALIDHGHNVTIVTIKSLDGFNMTGYRHIRLPEMNIRSELKDVVNTEDTFTRIFSFMNIIKLRMESGRDSIKNEKFQNLMNEEKFDVILLGYYLNDFQIGIAQHFKCPIVIINTLVAHGIFNDLMGGPSEISHVPIEVFQTKKLTHFKERVMNYLMYGVGFFMSMIHYSSSQYYYDELFPADKYPSFEEARRNVSLILCNHHLTDGPIRANVPAIVEIGGIQIKPKPDPLPKDIQEFLDKSNANGAVFFSLGSNVHSTDLQPATIKIIYKVLSELKQNVLWKWENEDITPGNSKNILFKKWLPQDDILAHKNIRLFITHGGKGSVVESQYHGVPMVGLPIFGDQPMNIEKVAASGFGIGLNYQTLTENEFRKAIQDVLTNSTYKDNVKHYSNLYRDRPMSARETAVYWIEYVIRHRGAPHLQSQAVHLNKIQYLGLDVIAFFAVIIYIWCKLSTFILKLIWRKLCGSNKQIVNNIISKKNKKSKTS